MRMRTGWLALAMALWIGLGPAEPVEGEAPGGADRLEALRAERAKLIEEARASVEAPPDRKSDEVKRAAQERSKLEKDQKKREEEARKKRAEELRARKIAGVETILDTGDSSRRVDIVLVGDGWTEKELPEYVRTCRFIADDFSKKVPPLKDYAGYINIFRVDAVCEESGIPYPSQGGTPGVPKAEKPNRTLFRTRLEGMGAAGNPILQSDAGSARSFVQGAVRDVDFVAIIANAGARTATAYRNMNQMTIPKNQITLFVAHEFGHAFGDLADEYIDSVNKDASAQSGPNVTTISDPLKGPWHYWNVPEAVFRGETAPLKFDLEKRVPVVEGGGLKAKGVWRPELRCLMNSDEFYCSVCYEQMERRFHRYVRLIDEASPDDPRMSVFSNETVELSMSPVVVKSAKAPSADAAIVRWFVDGEEKRSGKAGSKGDLRLSLAALGLKSGWHTVSCTLDYLNPRLRKDEGLMSDSRTWEIEVLPWARPHFKMQTSRYRASPGKEISIPIDYEPAYDAKEVEFRITGLPEGAQRDKDRIVWTPTEQQCGAWRILLSFHRIGRESVEALEEEVRAMKAGGKEWILARYVEGDRTELVRKEVWIEVPPLSAQGNTAPRFAFVPPQEIGEGTPFRLPLKIWEPDGDRILFSAERLPAGARLDPGTGVLSWTPGPTQGGVHKVEVSVTDGVKPDKLSFEIRVIDRGGGGGGGLSPSPQGVPGAKECREARIRRAGRGLRSTGASAGSLAELKDLLRPAEGRPPSRSYEEGPPEREVDATDYRILAQTLAVGKWTWTWALVDSPEVRKGLKEICDQALERKDLPGDARDVFKRVSADLAAIEAYDQRRNQPSK